MHCGVLNFLVVTSYLSLNRQNKMPIIVCPPAPTGSKVSQGSLLEIIHLGLLTKGTEKALRPVVFWFWIVYVDFDVPNCRQGSPEINQFISNTFGFSLWD